MRALAERLARDERQARRVVVLGFTSEIRRYMQLSDFFIGKPGPGSISEAIQQGLPVIVVRNTWTMPQERYNTEWVKRTTRRASSWTLSSSIRDGVDGDHRPARGVSRPHFARSAIMRCSKFRDPRAHPATIRPAAARTELSGRTTLREARRSLN